MHSIKKFLLLTGLTTALTASLGHLKAQTAKFNFSLSAHAVSGWTNVMGDPSTGVRSATSSGITLSSMATANWAPYSGTCAFDGGGASGASFFPSAVMANLWYQYSPFFAAYNAAVPQLEIGGLNIDSVYTIQMTGSLSSNVPNVFNLNPTRFTVAGTAVYGFNDVNENFNATDGATFHNIAPNSSGKIHIYVNTLSTTNVAGISGLQIISGHTTAPTPSVSITRPNNSDILPEDGNANISATATETGGTIAFVEFYAGTTLLGVDSVAPYNFLWSNPDPGTYAIKARAVDGLGNATSSTINITVESLNYFWSTTGNVNTGGDTSFIGTVDSNRLAFRTKNLERMTILPTGNIGIGTTIPSAQLHTTGSIRLAGLTNNDTQTRLLVSDSSGNIAYRNLSTVISQWQNTGTVQFDTVGSVAIGTTDTKGYKLAVNGTAIFTAVKIKPFTSWPDYVFDKNYHLKDLSVVERYLLAHRHLPDMVSASEVSREGIDVSVQQAALLKKVEELTLYVIELNKKVKRLSKENQTIRSRLAAVKKGNK